SELREEALRQPRIGTGPSVMLITWVPTSAPKIGVVGGKADKGNYSSQQIIICSQKRHYPDSTGREIGLPQRLD
ncbi:hypothetical protein, partial [Staphylococcus epidermidis]|uniref:hypothetical protein n=1 Tax=Staphylococcus epidermidis TaxID=1282 RepID=UPI00066D0B9F